MENFADNSTGPMSNSEVKQLSQFEIDPEIPLSEIFAGVDDEGFTHDEALEFMDITETEFLELLMESGNCPLGKLDKNRKQIHQLVFWEIPQPLPQSRPRRCKHMKWCLLISLLNHSRLWKH